jgi:hypothetical protein
MEKIFGYDWSDIQRAQQGGRLGRGVTRFTSEPLMTDDDRLMLEQHGSVDALERAGLCGVADRVRRMLAAEVPITNTKRNAS